MDNREKPRRSSADIVFILWATLVAIGLIIVSVALGVAPGIDPDQVLSIFAAP
jgi:hypothetical protein